MVTALPGVNPEPLARIRRLSLARTPASTPAAEPTVRAITGVVTGVTVSTAVPEIGRVGIGGGDRRHPVGDPGGEAPRTGVFDTVAVLDDDEDQSPNR